MPKVRRVLSLLCLLLFLGLPLAAQTAAEPAYPAVRFLAAVWERLIATLAPLAPLAAITASQQADEPGTDSPGTGSPEPLPAADGGGLWDPFG